jgi:DivIVA domain-containing protein
VPVDAETNQIDTLGTHRAEPVSTELTAEPVTPEADGPETAEPEATAPEATETRDRLTPDQLCDYLARASFPTVLGRRGYQQDEVDAFLVTVAESVREGEPLKELVRRTRFSTVRLEDGYDPHQVDDFLAAVVDLDPHAVAEPPEVGRTGLIGKLFG